MKKFYFLALLFAIPFISSATVHTISVSGFEYTPDTIVIQAGDSIYWDVTTSHPPLEVSESTYTSNGNTSNGGFSAADQDTLAFNTSGDYYYVCTNHFANGMKGMIVVEQAANFSGFNETNFSIYPNPTSYQFTIENVQNSKISVFNTLGQNVKTFNPLHSKAVINVSDWKKGAYFVRIEKTGAIVTRKVIVK